ncbi:MAG: hypothetical protein ACLUEQ_00125 [Cloacibacillus evryensis]
MKPEDIDFVVECSEEAAGDMNQRGGGNFAKAIAEIAGCANASGCDVRASAPVLSTRCLPARRWWLPVPAKCRGHAGGAIPKLYMNARDHVKKSFRS